MKLLIEEENNARFTNGLLVREKERSERLCHSGRERTPEKKLMQRGKLPTMEMYF